MWALGVLLGVNMIVGVRRCSPCPCRRAHPRRERLVSRLTRARARGTSALPGWQLDPIVF